MSNTRSRVHIAKVNPESNDLSIQLYSILNSYRESFCDGLDNNLKKEIIIKPNILPTELRNNGLGVTNPALCAHVADFLKDIGFKKIILAEGTTNNRIGAPDTLEAMKNNGFNQFLDKWDPIDMNKDDVGKWFEIYSPGDEENPENPFDIEVGISKQAISCPIISIAKFKSHDVLGLTLSIKNLMGCLTEARRKSTGDILHKGPRVKSYLHGFLARNPYQIEPRELNYTTSKTALAININRLAKHLYPLVSLLDAAPAMQGNGPLSGFPSHMNLILCSNDSVALDSVACKLVRLDLTYNQYIKNLERLGLGNADYTKIDIINEELITDFTRSNTFQFHEWFKNAKFSQKEIDLLKKQTH